MKKKSLLIPFLLSLLTIFSCKSEKKIVKSDSLTLPATTSALATVEKSVENSTKRIDYRQFQTSVKNQGYRGTCTAFSVASILEILPGVPADISEQYIYGALKHSQPDKTFSEGDFLKNYIPSLNQYGFMHEKQLPYNPNKNKWNDDDTEFTKVIRGAHLGKVSLYLLKYYAKYSLTNTSQFRYFGYNQASNPETIKSLLDSGVKSVAVVYSNIHVPTWVKGACNTNSPISLNSVINVIIDGKELSYNDAKVIYKGDIINAIKTQKVPNKFKDVKTNYGGHAVNIVGYNDKGFIFKNSWGEEWADKGYGYISYDLHRLTCHEALTISNVTFIKPKKNIIINKVPEFYLKSTLSREKGPKGRKHFQLSIFTSDVMSDPLINSVTYSVYGRNSKLIAKEIASVNNTVYDNSFTVDLYKNGELMEPDLLFGKPVNVVAELKSRNNEKKVFYFNDVYFKTAEYKSSTLKKVSNLLRIGN
ncbi:C1 family peptidase [Polaribacter sp.]|uniref:C1 family peptidase n=1 Tax=Polaribacter sp. TaxID=1920175 RepID=UPI003EF2921B